MLKKIKLGALTIGAISVPMVTVISCGSSLSGIFWSEKNIDKNELKYLFSTNKIYYYDSSKVKNSLDDKDYFLSKVVEKYFGTKSKEEDLVFLYNFKLDDINSLNDVKEWFKNEVNDADATAVDNEKKTLKRKINYLLAKSIYKNENVNSGAIVIIEINEKFAILPKKTKWNGKNL